MADVSEKRATSERPGIGRYLAGGFLGNTPMLFAVFALTFVEPSVLHTWTLYIHVLVYSAMFVGGVLAGFIVTRMVPSGYLVAGLIAGASCFLISVLYSLFLGFLLSEYFRGYLQLLVYCVGGGLGGILRQASRRRGLGGKGQPPFEGNQA